MNENFNGLSVGDKITTEILNEDFSVELSGLLKMTKGSFSQVRYYWCRLYKMKYEGYVDFDEIDGEDLGCTLGNIPVDNVKKLKETLLNSGLSTLANSIGFSSKEFADAAIEVMQKHKMFSVIFGEKAKIFKCVPKEEQTKVQLKFAIENYEDDTLVNNPLKRNFGIEVVDGVGHIVPDGVPTKEQLIEKLESLV